MNHEIISRDNIKGTHVSSTNVYNDVLNFVIVVCLTLVLEHLKIWVTECFVGGTRFIKRNERITITQIKTMLKPMEEFYLEK